jgi:uncharacterized protein YceH (UPF0502 family)
VDLNPVEIRVLGALIEKQRTTPDAYPLSLNGLRAACNQATNRDPVVDYDEATIREALTRLGRRRLTRLTSTQGSRAAKFRHLLDEALGLGGDDQAVLAVLMLRGAQTPGELRSRTERLHPFADAAALQQVLERLIDRELVERLDRRPGQKEERYAHRLAGGSGGQGVAGEAAAASGDPGRDVAAPTGGGRPPVEEGAQARLDRLEQRVEALTVEVAELRTAIGRAS